MKKSQEVAAVLTDEQAAALLAEMPVESSFVRTQLPRLGMVSQDKFEGKGKNAVLVEEAGTFFTEVQTNEADEAGKKTWEKTELGTEIDGVILFQRKQLRYYDEGTQEYTSSPIYDSNEELVPLFKNRVKVATDTPENLKKSYPGLTRAGKPTSKLNEDRILYVMHGEVLYQVNLHGSSMYAFLDYSRKNAVPTVVTTFNSTPEKNGSTEWNKMSFKVSRRITPEEAHVVLAKVKEIKDGIAAEKAYFNRDAAPASVQVSAADQQFNALGSGDN